jgi:hypothetical protein
MAGFRNVAALAAATESGRTHTCSFRKVPSQASTAGWWVDLSMAAGNPVPQYYAGTPLRALALTGAEGLWHGTDKSPATKHLTEIMLITPTAGLVGRYMLLDYLLCYPFVDLDSTDAQSMDNTVVLPRYTDGAGVQVMLVAAYPTVGGGSFTFDYVNQSGVTKTSPTISFSTAAANIASVITSEPATSAGGLLFLPLASGDTGVRSITSVTLLGVHGGLGAPGGRGHPRDQHALREVVREHEPRCTEDLRRRLPQLGHELRGDRRCWTARRSSQFCME